MTCPVVLVHEPPVLVMMGVSGCGKSTVAGLVAGRLGWDTMEGDDLHPAENVAKMAEGAPLTDEDRWPWLDTVASWITEHTMASVPGVITCSSLKRSYRRVLFERNVVFVHLTGSREQLAARMRARLDHFMPVALLDSQLATLEPLGEDEPHLVVDIGRKPQELAAEVIERLDLMRYAVPLGQTPALPPRSG